MIACCSLQGWFSRFSLLKYPALPVQALSLAVSSNPWVYIAQGMPPVCSILSLSTSFLMCSLTAAFCFCCSGCCGVSCNLLSWQFQGTVFFPCIGLFSSSARRFSCYLRPEMQSKHGTKSTVLSQMTQKILYPYVVQSEFPLMTALSENCTLIDCTWRLTSGTSTVSFQPAVCSELYHFPR